MWPAQKKNTKMILEKPFSVGKFVVSPLSRLEESGQYSSSVSIRRGMHDRLFRFVPRFATRDGALLYAIAEGRTWLHEQVGRA